MITKFGIWEIDEEYGLIGKVGPTYDYNIAKETLWRTTDIKGHIVWEWLMHLTEKTWIKSENFNDLVTAYIFAQEFFIKDKPNNALQASTAQTIFVAQQLIKINEESVDNNKNHGTDFFNEEAQRQMFDFLTKRSEIKLLNLK